MLVDRREETKAGRKRSKRLACIPEELGPALVSDSKEVDVRAPTKTMRLSELTWLSRGQWRLRCKAQLKECKIHFPNLGNNVKL